MTAANHSDGSDDDGALRVDEARKYLNRWRNRTIVLGVALAISISSVVPFLAGHSLHMHADTIGKYLIYLSMCLLTLFMGAAALTYNRWWYWRKLKG